MPTTKIDFPFEFIPNNLNGRPLASGLLYAGIEGLDPKILANQKTITARQENGSEIAITQPVSTNASGLPEYNGSVVQLLIDAPYSIRIDNAQGVQQYYAASVITPDEQLRDDLAEPDGTDLIGFNSETLTSRLNKVNIQGNENQNHFAIGCIPRNVANVWTNLDDANHTPLNIASISIPDITTVRVSYKFTASKINSFVAAPDDALAAHGVLLGGDVGTAFANIKGYAPLTGILSRVGATATFETTQLWTPQIGQNLNPISVAGSTVQLNHPVSVSNDMPSVALISGAINAGLTPVITFVNSSQVNVGMHSNAAGFVSFSGSSWSQALSSNVTPPVLTWQAGSSSIRVDHGVANSLNALPSLAQFGPYIPRVSNVGTSFFEVQFYNYSGVLITVQDTSMQFIYNKNLLVLSAWPDSLKVAFRRGPCILTTDCYGGVPGNNIWVTGSMQF